jgi:regulator of protease activity HflC (stomatin/prohibitin superfamily)
MLVFRRSPPGSNVKQASAAHNEILHAMQAQITAEREKRALIAASERRKQEQINIATGEREASIARSEGEKQAAIKRAGRSGGHYRHRHRNCRSAAADGRGHP